MSQSQIAPRARLSLATVLAFAATALPINAVVIAVAVYLPRHYASHLGISLAAVGGAFFIVRMIDIPVDGMLGWAMDKTRTRWGRYRAWSVLGAPVLMLAIWGLFMPPEGATTLYMIAFLLLMYLGNSILALSHAAWAATLAPSYDDRARIFGVLTGVGVIGAAVMLAIPIINQIRGAPDAHNVETMGWAIVLMTPICVALMVWRTPERITPDVPGQSFALKDYWALIARPTMARVMALDLLLTLGPGWMAAMYLFFFTDSRGFTTAQASILLAVYILAGFAGAPLTGRLATKISKHRAVMVTTTGYSLTLMSVILIPKGNMLVAFFPMFIAGFFAAGFTVLIRAMTADIADEVRLEQGKERSGLLFALTTMTNKIASAVAIGLTFTVLDAVGYVAKEGAVNTPEAITNLELAYLIGPIVFVMLGGLCMIGYRLGADRHADIRRQLDERDALYDEAPAIQSLTGEGIAVVGAKG